MKDVFHYSTLHSWHQGYYKGLLGKENVSDLITVHDIRYGFLQEGLNRYLLPLASLEELPLLPTKTETIDYRGKPYIIILEYKSARFKADKQLTFRQMVDDLCCFEHEHPQDYTLWKIMALASLLGRTAFRICSPPAFGKDSVMKVLGYLTGDVCVIANPTVAKLEYRLTNKVILLNEFANLKTEDKYGMEHFLQSVGDMSNTYEKRSRAGLGTIEKFDIGALSLVCAYNDLDCYNDSERYFDNTFGTQTKDRFVPLKLHGKISEQIQNVPDPEAVAEEHSVYLQQFVRSITWYRKNWREDIGERREWDVKTATDLGFDGRWASTVDAIRDFILLYAESAEEAQVFMNIIHNRNQEYKTMVEGNSGLLSHTRPKESEELVIKHERIEI